MSFLLSSTSQASQRSLDDSTVSIEILNICTVPDLAIETDDTHDALSRLPDILGLQCLLPMPSLHYRFHQKMLAFIPSWHSGTVNYLLYCRSSTESFILKQFHTLVKAVLHCRFTSLLLTTSTSLVSVLQPINHHQSITSNQLNNPTNHTK